MSAREATLNETIANATDRLLQGTMGPVQAEGVAALEHACNQSVCALLCGHSGLSAAQERLNTSENTLLAAEEELNQTKTALNSTSAELNLTKTELNGSKAELSQARGELKNVTLQLQSLADHLATLQHGLILFHG